MVTIFVMEAVHFIVQFGLIIDIGTGGGSHERADEWFDAGLQPFVQGVLIFFLIFNAVSLFMIGQLLWFHMNLQKEGLTTYQFIVKDHQRRRDRARDEEALESKRIVAIAKARDEKKGMYVMQLQMGGYCRTLGWDSCDPLQLPEHVEPDPEAGFGASLGSSPATSHDQGSTLEDSTEVPDSAEPSTVQPNTTSVRLAI